MILKKILTAIILIAPIILFYYPAQAATISCDGDYTIKSGDSLSSISLGAYEDPGKWNILYLQNKNTIGDNPSIIRLNASLFIPCIDNITFNNVKKKPSNESPKKDAEKPFHVDLVTENWPPYIGKKLPHQGMLLHITEEVFAQLPNTSYSVDYISDWSAHIDILLKKKKYDIGPGWYYQDCSDMSKVPESAKIRCEYRFSAPMYEEIITIYNKKGNNSAITELSELKNKTLCQPKGYLLFDYAKSGLKNGENFTLIETSSVKICMEKLRDNQVQYVAINKNEGDQTVSSLGLKDVIENKSTSPIDTRSIHYIIHKTHPKADVLIAKLNKALKNLRKSGRLFEIQSKHIQNFQNNL